MASLMLSRLLGPTLHTAKSWCPLLQISKSSHRTFVTTYSSSVYGNRTALLQSFKEFNFFKTFVSVRWFSTTCRRTAKKPARSWDVDGTVSKDTLVYSYKNDRYYRLITIFGITQLLFWGNLAVFSYSGLSKIDEQALKGTADSNSFWGQVMEYQVKYRYRIAVACVAVGKLKIYCFFNCTMGSQSNGSEHLSSFTLDFYQGIYKLKIIKF